MRTLRNTRVHAGCCAQTMLPCKGETRWNELAGSEVIRSPGSGFFPTSRAGPAVTDFRPVKIFHPNPGLKLPSVRRALRRRTSGTTPPEFMSQRTRHRLRPAPTALFKLRCLWAGALPWARSLGRRPSGCRGCRRVPGRRRLSGAPHRRVALSVAVQMPRTILTALAHRDTATEECGDAGSNKRGAANAFKVCQRARLHPVALQHWQYSIHRCLGTALPSSFSYFLLRLFRYLP
jgi:hypothetical protein